MKIRDANLTMLVVLAGLSAGLATPSARAASLDPAVTQDAGAWDLAFEKGNRRCRLTLRQESQGSAYAIALPAGCHKAFPMLVTVTGWRPGEGDHVLFEDETAAAVLDFAPTGGPGLSAVASESNVYTLMPNSQARQASLAGAAPATADAPAPMAAAQALAVAKPAMAPTRRVTTGEVAGNYAVVRQGRDTGCMVTLEDSGSGPKVGLRAKLAPACRDQGIVIFDPAGWQLVKNELVLTAKKGHTTELTLQDNGTWANAPATGRPLVLKRL